jgi:nitrogen fixation/metabolism regulation signal transduction histidine kinase
VTPKSPSSQSSLRQRILTFVGALIVLCLLGSTVSLYRISEVNRSLDVINRVSVPLGRLFAQMQNDGEVYQREFERSLGSSHWKDVRWRPRPVPAWIVDVLGSEMSRTNELFKNPGRGMGDEKHWQDWADTLSKNFDDLRDQEGKLGRALEARDELESERAYSRWNSTMEAWKRQIQSGAEEYDREFRRTFSVAESRVAELQTGLELILFAVILLSLMLLWVGERALRPLAELTQLARDISRRGLKKEDKALLPQISIARSDEVSQLAREFHNMATALLEREKTVESQKHRLLEQNALLREMGELNENVLQSIESVLIVIDLEQVITQCNPVAERFLEMPSEKILGRGLSEFPKLLEFFGDRQGEVSVRSPAAKQFSDGKFYGARLMPLKGESGAILVIEDLTEELSLQERLQQAENLAAVGRMSAQVAHEVRNPLHSIGLEAEMATELAQNLGSAPLKQSLQSILSGVDRLEKITDNYLRLSRLSGGKKTPVDLGTLLENALATYAPVCEAQGIRVDWRRAPRANLRILGDGDLLEQVIGNLFRNATQAGGDEIDFSLGETESGRVWLRIEDNGTGVPEEIRRKLFNPFVTTRAQGTGLGLSFVKKVVEDHGGEVSLIARPSGKRGACFEILLPALDLLNRSGAEVPKGPELRAEKVQ